MNASAGEPPVRRPVVASRVLVLAALLTVIGSAVYRAASIGRTFFIDEIWVVDMVRDGVYRPGAVPQPPLFFFANVAWSRLCGFSESCLRLPSLFASILLTLVPLGALRCTRGLLDARGALVWTILLAVSSPIVFYSGRVKQYSTEALGSAAILAAFLAVAAMPADTRRWRTYFVLSAVLVPLLHSAGLTVLGTGLALTWIAARNGRRAGARVLAGHAGLGLLFVAAYLAYMRPGPETTRRFGDLYDYFRANADPVFFDGSLRFLVQRTGHWMGHLLNLTRGMALVASTAILLWLAWRLRQRDWTSLAIAVACIVPPAAVLAASAAELYPYGEVRLMIFAAPGFFLLLALAVQHASRLGRRIGLVASVAAASFMVLFVAGEVRHEPYNATYMGVADLRTTYSYLRIHHRNGVPIMARKAEAIPLEFYRRGIEPPDVVSIDQDASATPFPRGEFWMLLRRGDPIMPAGGEVLVEEGGLILLRYRN